jgi:SAM-dependent methyltransferase
MPHATDSPAAENADLERFFDADYAYFYEHVQTPERAAREVDLLIDLLNLGPQARVLDAACGYGRIGVRLAAHGFDIVGVDMSEVLVDRARELADELGAAHNARFVQADLRQLPFDAEFDAAFCWFSSFGFFDEADDRRILEQIGSSIKPGGRLAMEVIDRNAARASLRIDRSLPVLVSERGDDAIVDRVRLSPERTHIVIDRIVARDTKLRRITLVIRTYDLLHLRTCLREAGFSKVWDHQIAEDEAELFTRSSLIVVAER